MKSIIIRDNRDKVLIHIKRTKNGVDVKTIRPLELYIKVIFNNGSRWETYTGDNK